MTDQAVAANEDDGYGPSLPIPVAALPVVNAARQPAPLAPAATLAAFVATIERLEQVIDQETRELRKNKAADLREFNHRKSQGLLELSRATRGLKGAALDEKARAKLTQLRVKLDANVSVLRMHLMAAQEISAVISHAIQDAESDGTYSATLGFRGQERC
ncbi:MAG: hypothetical protein ACHQAY_00995 [Hyphomicrobiales bacterium]